MAGGRRKVTENAREIRELGQDLHKRLNVFVNHLQKVGRSLGNAVESFNSAVGSMERNVMPQARKFPELSATTDAPIEPVDPIEKAVRTLDGARARNRRILPTRPALLLTHEPTTFDPRRHSPAPDELRGRVIMVTGAGSGIGRAVALALAGAGAEVILLGRTVRKLEAVHAEIAALGRPRGQHRAARSRTRAGGGLRSRRRGRRETLWPPRRPAAQRRLVRRR